MMVSSVARAGLVTETQRPDVAQATVVNNSDVASATQAVQQQATASNDAQVTRAPEQTAGAKLAVLLNGFGGASDVPDTSETEAASENNLLDRSVVTQNNATLQQQIQARVQELYGAA
jgi:hypothetical protein